MTSDEVKALVWRFVDEPWNKGNVAVFDEVCGPEYTVRGADGVRSNLNVIKQGVIETRAEHRNFQATVDDIIVDGDQVAYGWKMTGIDKQGNEKTFVGITILRLKNGKIVDDRFVAEEVKTAQPAA